VGTIFSMPIQTNSEILPASCTFVLELFPGCKAAGEWCWPLTPT